MKRPNYPRFVALCGAPGAGKSTVAQILATVFHAVIVDDGLNLRRAIPPLFGGLVAEDAPFTQEGKATEVVVCGKTYTVRQLLGDVGTMLETFYGDQIMPELAVSSAAYLPEAPFYVFPSCRKNQAKTYRSLGGLVVEITRPGYEPVNDFDHYDRDLITHTIKNDGDKFDLQMTTVDLFDLIYDGSC